MNKKIYFTPTVRVVKITTPCMQTASVDIDPDPITNGNDVGAKGTSVFNRWEDDEEE